MLNTKYYTTLSFLKFDFKITQVSITTGYIQKPYLPTLWYMSKKFSK